MLVAASWNYLSAQNKSYFCQELSWSPDGERMCFSARTEKDPYEIYVVNADGTGLTRLTSNSFEDYWTAWSPGTPHWAGFPSQSEGLNLPLQDGSKIAFNTNRDGNYEIYIMNADGSNAVRLTNHTEKDIGPSISPNGKKIAFTSARDGNLELYVMNIDGTGLKRLTNTPHKEYNPQWSPDGKKLVYYYEKGDGKDQIYIVNVDGTKPKNITNNTANNFFPAWLPNGREIVFTSNLDSVEAVYSIKTDGSGLKKINTAGKRAFFARYSPDGSKIAVITGGWPASNITIMNADGTNPVTIDLELLQKVDKQE